MSNLRKTLRKSEDSVVGQVLTLFSTASATGKTILAINFAADLAERGYRVCLLDCDLQFGDVADYLKLSTDKSLFAMYENESTNAADLATTCRWNFDVLAAPKELDEAYVLDADIVSRAINHLRANYDYVIVDTTTGFSDINLCILEKSDYLFLPCVVDFIPSIKNLKLGLERLAEMQIDSGRMRLILNRNKAETQIGVKDVEELLGRKFDYLVANDYSGMMNSIKDGQPIVLSSKDSALADDISSIMATELGDKDSASKSGLLGWLWK